MTEINRYKLICCEIMFREFSSYIANSKNIIDASFLPKALHDIGETKMSARLQEEIDKVDHEKYDAILLGYGLCNNGIRGLHASIPIVVPRAHDCITILLGSRQRYNDYFYSNTGTFFKSSGWIERDANPNDTEQSITSQLGMNRTYQQYLEQFGEENAKYLMEMLGDWTKNYKKIAFINTNVGNIDYYREVSKEHAMKNGWDYEELQGDSNIIRRLLDGQWDPEDFLVVPPNKTIKTTFDEKLVGI